MIDQSIITCPRCGHQATERMPADACQFFYVCRGCGERLKPLAGIPQRVFPGGPISQIAPRLKSDSVSV